MLSVFVDEQKHAVIIRPNNHVVNWVTVDIYDHVRTSVILILTTTRQIIESRSTNEDMSHVIYGQPHSVT